MPNRKNLLIISTLTISLLFLSILSFGKPVIALTLPSIDQRQQYDIDKNCAKNTALVPDMVQILTYFNCGHATFYDNGTTLRQFTLIITENHKLPITMPEDSNGSSIMFPSWTMNSSIPAPTIRVTKDDHVEITVVNHGTMPHSLHMHSIHPGIMDGVPIISGDSGFISPGQQFTYKFTASPVGIFPYHCHMTPIQEHINRGLYGALIIDPPFDHQRPKAQEIVMYLNGYDLDIKNPEFPRIPTALEANAIMNGNTTVSDNLPQEHDNSVYSVNGIANYYMHHPVSVRLNEPLRIYMFNMLDFETNSFHLHGQLFQYYPSGTSENPMMTTDIVMLDQGDRGIIETKFTYPGLYMVHAHRDAVGGRGWQALFSVK